MRLRICSMVTAALILMALVTLSHLPATAQAPAAKAKPAPRLANGKVDLSGVWDHPRVGDLSADSKGCAGGTKGCSNTGAKELDSLQTPFGKELNSKEKFDYGARCMPWGYVRSWGTPYPVELIQNSQRLVILFEQNNQFHVIPTDGRSFPKDLEATWLGTSLGHYEGETLVVDTIGFNGRTWLDTQRERLSSDALKINERFDRPDAEHINYEMTIEDSKMYTKPFKNTRVFVLMKPGEELLEYACTENNKDLLEGHIK